jgi:hypothetical protein
MSVILYCCICTNLSVNSWTWFDVYLQIRSATVCGQGAEHYTAEIGTLP